MADRRAEASESIDDDRLGAALTDAFPDRPVAGVDRAGVSWNAANRTVEVAFADGGRAFLKYALDGDGRRIARERAALGYVDARCPVAAPSILAARVDGGVPYLATAPMAGRNLNDRWDALGPSGDAGAGAEGPSPGSGEDADGTGDGEAGSGAASAATPGRVALARRLGWALAAVHGHRFDAHGEIVGGGADGLALDERPWPGLLVDRVEAMASLAPADRFADHFDRVIDAVEADRDRLAGAPATLVHGDPARPNCFVTDRAGHGVGLVDWELAHVGDPARDLHRARSQALSGVDGEARDRLAGALFGGYRDRAGSLPDGYDERRPVYEAVRYLGRSGQFGNWVEYLDADEEDYARRVEAEMTRRLDRLY